MTTSSMKLDDTWKQVTDGVQDYNVQLHDMNGDNVAKMTLSDTTPDATTPFFTVKEGEGFSQITHPGKLWAQRKSGKLPILVINK